MTCVTTVCICDICRYRGVDREHTTDTQHTGVGTVPVTLSGWREDCCVW